MPALTRSASALLGDGSDAQALLSWVESQGCNSSNFSTLSDVESTVTAKELAANVEMLLALGEDTEAADRMWSGNGVLNVAESIVG